MTECVVLRGYQQRIGTGDLLGSTHILIGGHGYSISARKRLCFHDDKLLNSGREWRQFVSHANLVASIATKIARAISDINRRLSGLEFRCLNQIIEDQDANADKTHRCYRP